MHLHFSGSLFLRLRTSVRACVMRLVWRFWCFSLLMLCHFCSKHDLCHWSVCLLRRNKLWFGVVYGTLLCCVVLWLSVLSTFNIIFSSFLRAFSPSFSLLFLSIYIMIFFFLFAFFYIFIFCVVLLHNNCYASFWFIAVFPLKIRFFFVTTLNGIYCI